MHSNFRPLLLHTKERGQVKRLERVASPGDGLWMHGRHVDSKITPLSVVACFSWMIVGGARKSCDHTSEVI